MTITAAEVRKQGFVHDRPDEPHVVHGRFSGFGAPVNWIAADTVRIQNGILVEHWGVIQDVLASNAGLFFDPRRQ
jgi:hypothetical protein